VYTDEVIIACINSEVNVKRNNVEERPVSFLAERPDAQFHKQSSIAIIDGIFRTVNYIWGELEKGISCPKEVYHRRHLQW